MSTLILVFHPHLKDGSRVNARLLAELAAQGEDDIIVRDEYAEYPNFSVNADTGARAAGGCRPRNPSVPVLLVLLPPRYSRNGKTRSSPPAGPTVEATHSRARELKLVVTTGSDAAKYRKDGEYSHTMEELLSPFEVVAYKVGMNYAEPFLGTGHRHHRRCGAESGRRRLCFGDFGLNKLRPGASRTRPCCFFRGQAAGSLLSQLR